MIKNKFLMVLEKSANVNVIIIKYYKHKLFTEDNLLLKSAFNWNVLFVWITEVVYNVYHLMLCINDKKQITIHNINKEKV